MAVQCGSRGTPPRPRFTSSSRYSDSPRSEPAGPRVDLYRAREPHDLPGSRRRGYDQNSSQA